MYFRSQFWDKLEREGIGHFERQLDHTYTDTLLASSRNCSDGPVNNKLMCVFLLT